MKTLKLLVKTKSKKYPIFIGENIINKKLLSKELINSEKILIIFDSKVPKMFIKKIKNNLKFYNIFTIKINTNERIKNISTVLKIINYLLNKNFNRNDCIISVGGGILGDVASFAASIFKRGIKFINIPTTLLSQVDSSIGGKTGVNSKKYGKNLIGTFYQPNLVLIDIATIQSLPRREIVCGYAEILKHAIISNKKNFNWLNKEGNKIINLKNKKLIQKAIYESCRIKAKVVEKDEKEKKIRKILNFGHTFAHAFESTKKLSKNLNHGEAVLIGMICAIEFAVTNKLLKKDNLEIIKNHYKKLNLPLNIKKHFKKKDIKKIITFMKSDKKIFSKDINLVLIKKIGHTPVIISFSENKLREYLSYKLS